MFAFALSGFSISLVALTALFTIKQIELSRGVVYAPEWRAQADRFARMIKATLRFALARTERLPHDALISLRRVIHIAAVLFARGARAAEAAAFKIADRVSHKHHFERVESKSAFLKTVSEHKSTLATTRPELK